MLRTSITALLQRIIPVLRLLASTIIPLVPEMNTVVQVIAVKNPLETLITGMITTVMISEMATVSDMNIVLTCTAETITDVKETLTKVIMELWVTTGLSYIVDEVLSDAVECGGALGFVLLAFTVSMDSYSTHSTRTSYTIQGFWGGYMKYGRPY